MQHIEPFSMASMASDLRAFQSAWQIARSGEVHQVKRPLTELADHYQPTAITFR